MKTTNLFIAILLFIIIIISCTRSVKNDIEKIDCTNLRKDFDKYYEKSQLPIIENQESLCYGLNMGLDFSKLDPKWAVGKLVDINPDFHYSLTFEGYSKKGNVSIPLTDAEISNYNVGGYYKIDMNNICRQFFMMVDSRSPSDIAPTFIKPQKVDCE